MPQTRTLCFVCHDIEPVRCLAAYLGPLAQALAAAAGGSLAILLSPAMRPEADLHLHLRQEGADAGSLMRAARLEAPGPALIAAAAAARARTGLPWIALEAALDDPAGALAQLAGVLDVGVPPDVLALALTSAAGLRAAARPFAHAGAFDRALRAMALAPCALGVEHWTGAGQAGAAALIAGWYETEPWGAWSRGRRAVLGLVLPPGAGWLTLRCSGMLVPDIGLTVTVDGAPVPHSVTDDHPPVIAVPIAPATGDDAGPRCVAVAFAIGRPVRAGPQDGRHIAVGIGQFRLDPCDPLPADPPKEPVVRIPPGFLPTVLPIAAPCPFPPLDDAAPVVAIGAQAASAAASLAGAGIVFGAGWAVAPHRTPEHRAFHSVRPAAAIAAMAATSVRPGLILVDGLATAGIAAEALADFVRDNVPGATLVGREATREALAATLCLVAPILHDAAAPIVVDGLWWRATSVHDAAERGWVVPSSAGRAPT